MANTKLRSHTDWGGFALGSLRNDGSNLRLRTTSDVEGFANTTSPPPPPTSITSPHRAQSPVMYSQPLSTRAAAGKKMWTYHAPSFSIFSARGMESMIQRMQSTVIRVFPPPAAAHIPFLPTKNNVGRGRSKPC